MANKPKNNVRKNVANLNSPWLKNALKSMGVASTDVIKDLVPATSETIKSTAGAINETVNNLKRNSNSQMRVTDAIKNNPVTKMAGDFFKNAIQDVKSGNIYNTEREMNLGSDSDDDFGSDIDTLFDDIDEYASNNEDENITVNNNLSIQKSNSDASIKAVREQTSYQLKAAQATIDTMASISSNSLIKMDEIGQSVLSELAAINSNLAAMIDYNNTNMTKFIEASIGYYEQMSGENDDSYGGGSSKVDQNAIFGSKGGLDFNSYKEYVKGNIKDLKENSAAGGMINMILENKDRLISNPVGMGIKMGLTQAIPEIVRTSLDSFDKSLKNLIPTILERIGSLGENDNTFFGGVLRNVGGVLGIKNKRKSEFDTSDIKKGPMPYNGVVNHTLVEIIPKYLRESNSYLKEIAQSITGKNNKELLKSTTGFNWETGKFMDINQIRDELYEQLQMEVTSSFERSSFGKKLENNGNLLKNQKDQENYSEALAQLYNAIERHEGELNFNDTDSLNNIMGQVNASDSIKNLIRASIQDMKDANDDSWGSAYAAKREATRKKNSLMRSFEQEANENGLRQIGDDISYDKWAMDKYSNTASLSGKPSASSLNMSVPSLLTEIRNVLVRGIYVQTKKKLGPMPSGSGSVSYSSEETTTDAEIIDSPQQTQSYDEFKDQLSQERRDEDEYNNEINLSNSSKSLRQRAGNSAANKIHLFTGVMNGIVNGSADEAWDAFIQGIGDTFKKAGDFMKEHFLGPIKETLFGTKDENGYIEGGIFAGVNNRMKESFYGLRKMITGKGYIDAEGNQVPDANEDEMKNTVAGKLKSMLGTIKDGISLRLFGNKDDEDVPEEDKKEGAIGKVKKGLTSAASSFYNGLTGWKNALFGKSSDNEDEDPEKTGKKIFEDIKKKATDVLPTALTGSIVGAGAGMLSGGLLGVLVGGPVGGAMLGLAGGIASKSDKFKTWLFGKDEEDGSHTEGLIKKSTQDFFKENGKFIAGGAALGLVKGTIFGGGGVLGALVGGPLAGALLGAGTSMLIKSDMFQKFIFGDEENGQLGMKQHFQRWIGKFGKKVDGTASGGKAAGMVGVGALGGGALGMLFGGPVVGSVLGLSAGIIAQKDNFHEWLFGTEDEDGNKKEGILGQFKNMLTANVFRPLGNKFKAIGADFKTFLKYDVLGRINLITERMGDAIFGGLSRITGSVMTTVGDFGSYLKENFLGNLVEVGRKITAPIASAAGTIAQGVYSAGKKLISMPITLIDAVTSPIAGAVAKTVGTAAKVAFKSVDLLIGKPIKNLVIKPLGLLVKGVGNIVAAPFKLLATVADKVNFGIKKFSTHVSNFFFQVKEEFKSAIMNSAPVKWIKARAKNVKEFGARVKDTIKEFVSPVTDLAKSAIHQVTLTIKKKIKGFFGKLLNALNPLTWIRKGIRGGKKIANFFGAGFNTENKPKKKEGRLARIWRETGEIGYRRDYSNYLTYDEDGNITGRKDSPAAAKRRLKKNRDNERLDNKRIARENRDRSWNEKRIAKLTNNQRVEDTEENRKLAEIMSGKTIGWKKVDPKVTEAQKIQEEQADTQKDIKKDVSRIADFLTGKIKRKDTYSRNAKMEELGKEHGEAIRERDEKVRNMFDRTGSYHGKIENSNIKKSQAKVRKKESEARQDLFNENFDQYGAINGLKANAKYILGNFKGLRMPKHADGTNNAKPGMAIVGEKGPEAMYSKNSKTGKFVGLNGPEVINLKGGETIIPNNRIQKFADGTSDVNEKTSVFTNILKAIKGLKDIVKDKLNDITDNMEEKSFGARIDDSSTESDEPEFHIKGAGINKKALLERMNKKSEDAQLEVSGNTGEKVHAQKAAEKEAALKEAKTDKMHSNISALSKVQHSFSSGWNAVFGLKKGAITGLILMAIPLLIKFLSNFNLGGLIERIGGAVKDGVSDLINDFLRTERTGGRTNGNTMGEQAQQELEDIKNGNVLTDANGDAHHQTDPAVNILARLGKNFFSRNYIGKHDSKLTKFEKKIFQVGEDVAKGVKKVGKKTKDIMVSGGKKVKKFFTTSSYDRALGKSTSGAYDNLLHKSVKYDKNGRTIIAKSDWEKLVKEFPEAADELKSGGVVIKKDASIATKFKNSKVGKTIDKVKNSKVVKGVEKGKATIKEGVDAVKGGMKNAKNVVRQSIKKTGQKGDQKLFTKICGHLDNFIDFISKKFAKKTGKNASKGLLSIGKNVTKALKSKWDKVCTKIATKLGVKGGAAAVSFGLSEVVFATIGAVNGLSGTAKLFNVSPDKVDGNMKIIASIFGALAGTTVGGIVDMVLSIAGDIAGVDFLNSMAVTLYSLMVGPGSDKVKALEEAQEEWYNVWQDERDAKVEEQYITQKKAGIISAGTTKDEFIEGVNNGKYNVSYKSFNDWNVEKNKSLGDKAGEFVGKGFKTVKNKGKELLNKFTGYEEEVITDDRGNTYKKNPDGTYNVIGPDGKDLGMISGDALPSNVNIETVKHKGLIGNIKDGVKSGWNKFTKGAADLGSNIAKGVKSGWNKFTKGAADLGKSTVDKVKNVVNKVKNSKVVKGASEAAKNVHDFFMSHKEKVWFRQDGTYYKLGGDGFYLYSANGDKISDKPVDPESLNVTELKAGEITEKSGLSKKLKSFGETLKNGWDTAVSGLQSFASNVGKKAKKLGGKLKKGFNTVKKNVHDFFMSHKEKVWFTQDGSYYKQEGDGFYLYSANGDKISDKPMDGKNLNAAELREGEITEDSGIKKKLKSFGETLKNGWDTAVSGLQSFASNVGKKAKKLGGKLKKGFNTLKKNTHDFFMSHTETRWQSSEGGYYQSNGTTFDYYNAAGDKIAEGITADEFENLCKSGVVVKDEGKKVKVSSGLKKSFKEVGAKIKDTFDSGIKHAKGMYDKVKKGVSTVLGEIKEKGIAGYIGGFFKKEKSMVWYDTQGNYFKLESNGSYTYYNMNGDKLKENVPAERIEELKKSGLLKEGEVVKDSKANKAIKSIKEAAQSAWDKAKDTVTNGWNNFKSWLTGGSGDGFQTAKDIQTSSGGHGGRGNYRSPSRFVRGGRGDEEAETYNGSTYYSQKDPRWASKKYLRSDGQDDGATMGDSGCAPTAMAMALSDVKSGKKITPTKLAKFAQQTGDRDNTGTNWNFVNKAAYAYGVSSDMQENPSGDYIKESLKSGNPVLLSGQDDGSGTSPYTSAGHYVVAVGQDGSGNIIINDPRGKSYSKKMNANSVAERTGAAWSFADAVQGGRGKIAKIRDYIRGGRGKKKNWLAIVAACKKSIGEQKKGYSQTGYIDVTVDGKTINTRRDCSGFVSVCLSFYTGKKILTSSAGFESDNSVASYMKSAGFKKIKWSGWNNVKAGDIFCTGGSHVEICAKDGTKKVYNCGWHDSCNNPGITNSGHSSYNCIWRPKDPGSASGGAKITTHKSKGSSSRSSSSSSLDFMSKATTAFSGLASALFEGASGGKFNRNWDEVFGLSDNSGSSDSESEKSGINEYSGKGSSNKALMRVFNDTWVEEMGKRGPGYYHTPLKSDGAGWNYGVASLTQKYNMGPFLDYMKKKAPKLRKKLHGKVGTSEFNNSWANLGRTNKDEFFDLQLKYLLQSKFEPALSSIKSKTGTNLNDGTHTEGLMSMLMSMSNQRPAWINEIWVPYMNSHKKASDADIINATGGRIAKSYSGVYADGVRARYTRQTAHSLKMKTPFKYSSKIMGGNGEGPMSSIYDKNYYSGGYGETSPNKLKANRTVEKIRTIQKPIHEYHEITKTNTQNNNSGNIELLLSKVIELLGSISTNSNKLQLLDKIKNQGSNINLTTNNTTTKVSPNGRGNTSTTTQTQTMSANEKIARDIAFGL